MSKIFQRAAAKHDLLEYFVYLAENAGIDVAERFLTNAEVSFNDLADQPLIGTPLVLQSSELAGMRKWRVKDVDNFLIFDRQRPEGVSIVRVLHAARDWWRLLGINE